jgi:hypothetical protein
MGVHAVIDDVPVLHGIGAAPKPLDIGADNDFGDRSTHDS